VQERLKAEKMLTTKSQPKKPAGTTHKKIRVSEAFSQGEKDLYKEVEKIKQKKEEEKREIEEKEKLATMPREYTGMPEPPLITSLRKKAVTNYMEKLTDTEVDDVESLLHKIDAKSKGIITVGEFKTFIQKLYDDESNIGKVPNQMESQEIDAFIKTICKEDQNDEQNEEKAISEIPVPKIMKNLNKLSWRLLSDAELKVRIDKYYAEVFFRMF